MPQSHYHVLAITFSYVSKCGRPCVYSIAKTWLNVVTTRRKRDLNVIKIVNVNWKSKFWTCSKLTHAVASL